MDGTIIIVLSVVLLFGLLALGAPFYVAFLASAMPVLFWVAGQGPLTLADLAVNSIRGYSLVAIPLFILLGSIMSVCGATTVLFNVARAFVGWLPGGLAIAAIVACAMFGTMCGSGVATALAIGTIAVPELTKAGYKRETAAAICGCAGGLGLLIPPSIGFIVLGEILEVNVGDLFMAGIVPGLICMAFLSIAAYFRIKPKVDRGEIQLERHYSWRERGKAVVAALPVAFVPLAIVGSLWGGICTPTEASGVGVVAGLLLAIFYFRKFGWKEASIALRDTVRSSAAIFCMVLAALTYGRALSFMRIPQMAGNALIAMELGLHAFKLAFFGTFFMLGMIFEAWTLWFVCLPPLVPSLALYPAIALVPFGVMFQLVINVGQITPPVGVTLYAAATGAKAGAGATIREMPLFLLAVVATTLLVLFVPAVASIY